MCDTFLSPLIILVCGVLVSLSQGSFISSVKAFDVVSDRGVGSIDLLVYLDGHLADLNGVNVFRHNEEVELLDDYFSFDNLH